MDIDRVRIGIANTGYRMTFKVNHHRPTGVYLRLVLRE
jgi:hypothetical protein